jgi:NAD(P)-dependent dehydrogenase (short-subunit alcohol dehydrogenase family)
MPKTLRCDPKLFEKDLINQVIIVTGANSGCGLETSRQLVKQGATVILACRSPERGEAATKDVGGGGVFLPLDLASLESIRNFSKEFLSKYDRLDALINNAGIMACPYAKTKDGFEMQISCNHLGHFLLLQLLAPLLVKTADTTGKPSRFVALSSCAASDMVGFPGPAIIDFDDLNWETRTYDQNTAYKQSKLANYLHALEASKKYSADKLICASVHPGWVQSNLDAHMVKTMFGDGWFGATLSNAFRKIFLLKGDMISAVDGAQTTLYCVLEDADKMESGAFYSQFGAYKDKDAQKGGWPMKMPNPNATPEAAAKLWVLSEELVAL